MAPELPVIGVATRDQQRLGGLAPADCESAGGHGTEYPPGG